MHKFSISTMILHLGFILGLLFSLLSLSAQESLQAVRFAVPPVIDGMVDEDIWETASPVTNFIQREPDFGAPFSEKTEVFIGYDEHQIYMGFRCYADKDEITAKEFARDISLKYDDRIQVILDTYLDRRNAYWFQIGPRGSIGDAIVSENGAAFNKAWDGLWTGEAKIHENGWDAEIAIPFKTLSFKQDQETWGIKLIRMNMSNQESGYWPEANLDSHPFQVSDGGILTGIRDITQGIGLDIIPYALTGADFKQGNEQAKPMIDGGLDAYYRISSNLQAALTINTDFAQTEVDDQQINLTRFNLFYPEKRDFFLDGANYFNFGINGDRENRWNTRMIPFFSRRIGLDNRGNPIPMQVGSKITGQVGMWNIGAMYMKDERNGWKNSNFAISRISRNFGDQSQAGIISTYGNALYDTSNFVIGLDLKLGTSKFRGNKNVSMSMYGLKSITKNQYNDNESSRNDLAWGLEFSYPNDLLFLRLGHMQVQENFIAGLGFVPRSGIRDTYGEFRFSPRPERWGIIQLITGFGMDLITDFNNDMQTREWRIMPAHFRFNSGDEINYSISSSFEKLDNDFNIYDQYLISSDTYTFLYHSFSLQSAQNRKLWGGIDYRTGGFYDGTRDEIKFKSGYKIAVPLFFGAEVIRNNISITAGDFIAYVYRINLNVLFNPNITLYSFVQYDSESSRMGWQSRFQWILHPGREIYFVWNSLHQDPYERFTMEEASMRLKVKYAIRF
jgi:hypothetical protein